MYTKLDKDGKAVTNKKGKPVTVKAETTKKKKTSRVNADTTGSAKTTAKETKPVKVTGTTKKNVPATKSDDTTAFDGIKTVPKTSATGKEVNFSKEDQQIIANMLEVPYLYLASYENSKGVPINIAAYTAVWMAQHDGGTASTYPSSPVVLNLFKFYGQTVVNFKTQVNKVDSTPIKYNSKNDTFSVSKYPKKKQTDEEGYSNQTPDNNHKHFYLPLLSDDLFYNRISGKLYQGQYMYTCFPIIHPLNSDNHYSELLSHRNHDSLSKNLLVFLPRNCLQHKVLSSHNPYQPKYGHA